MNYDFIIIGGGIAGISAAARIAPMGRTLVLEAESSLAYHASGRSAALFEEHYGAPSVVALNQAGKTYLHEAHGGVLSERGIMMVAHNGEEDQLTHEAKAFAMEPISIADAQAIVPILNASKLTAAAHSLGAKDIDTDLLIQNFARDARAAGAEIRTGVPVTALQKTQQGWDVTSGAETFTTTSIINAAGAWADQIAAMAGVRQIGFQPYRRSVARVPAPTGQDITHWPMLFGVGEGWYAKPDAGQLIVSPAEEDPQPPCDAWAEDMVLAEGIALFSDAVTYEVTRMTANWAGLRTFAPDRTLVLGRDLKEPSFIWCAGQGGYGFQTSPGASALLAELISGATPTLDAQTVASLSPARFD